jgi:uncharacterized membrane protein
MRTTDSRLTSTLALVATSVWLGGILVLGAIVAPIVFTMVPRPEAVEAMTSVFQRFDLVAVGSVAVIVATEAWRALAGRRVFSRAGGPAWIGRLDVARMLVAVVGAALVLTEAVWITPAIVNLHRHGAIRGLGADGLELDRMHGLAETCGKVQVVFALALVALHVATLAPGAAGRAEVAKAPGEVAGGGATHGA